MGKLYKNTVLFYMTDLNIHNFQYPQNTLEPSPMDIVCFLKNENLTRTMAARVLENKHRMLRSLRKRGTHEQGKQAVTMNACFKSWFKKNKKSINFFFLWWAREGQRLEPSDWCMLGKYFPIELHPQSSIP